MRLFILLLFFVSVSGSPVRAQLIQSGDNTEAKRLPAVTESGLVMAFPKRPTKENGHREIFLGSGLRRSESRHQVIFSKHILEKFHASDFTLYYVQGITFGKDGKIVSRAENSVFSPLQNIREAANFDLAVGEIDISEKAVSIPLENFSEDFAKPKEEWRFPLPFFFGGLLLIVLVCLLVRRKRRKEI